MKRFIVFLTTLCLVFGISCVSAWADEVNEWQTVTTLDGTNRKAPAVAAVGDEIYIISGELNKKPYSKEVDIYNTKTKVWRKGTPIPTATLASGVSVVNEKIYVFSGDGAYKQVQIYDTKTDTWSNGSEMSDSKYGVMATTVNGRVYVVGGRDGKYPNALDIYDPATDKWSSGESIPTRVDRGSAVAFENRIYIIGGLTTLSGNGATNAVQIYDIKTNKWTTGPSMPTARAFGMAAVINDDIYVMGGAPGANGELLKTVEIYNITTDTWSSGPSLKTARGGAEPVVIDGKIYLAGYLNTIETLQVTQKTSTNVLSVLINIGETVQLSTSFDLENNKNFTWSSTNEAVATVDANGRVTAIAEGTADIYAQNADGTFKEYIPVKVVKGIADELRLAVHLKIGEKTKLYLTDDASKVTWTSMDDSIATVAADGQVTGVKKGLAIIKAELDGQAYQIYVRVNG